MPDLFGDTITAPAVKRQSRENMAQGFAEFWQVWPRGPRKVAKQQCLDKWAKLGCCEIWQQIVAHVEWMKHQTDWCRENCAYIPMPMTYLNQQRWVDWEPVEVPKRPDVDPELARLKAEAKAAKGIPSDMRDRLKAARGMA